MGTSGDAMRNGSERVLVMPNDHCREIDRRKLIFFG